MLIRALTFSRICKKLPSGVWTVGDRAKGIPLFAL